jgi:hypothetical protein
MPRMGQAAPSDRPNRLEDQDKVFQVAEGKREALEE